MKKENKSNKGKKKAVNDEEVVILERLNDVPRRSVSEGFYYLFAIVVALVLIFSTAEILNAINYLFVVIFAVISVILIINFIMNKDYTVKNYSNIVSGIVFGWLALFIFQYGNFLFLEMLPVLLSLLLFLMGISSLIKYFDFNRNGNLVVAIISFVLGISLIFIPRSIMYLFFKIVGIYVLVMVILDYIDYKKNKYDKKA